MDLATTDNTLLEGVNDLDIDSEDEMNSIADDTLDNYNIPANLKNILRLDSHLDVNVSLDNYDDSESDDDLLKMQNLLDLNAINAKVQENRTKFSNFGAPEEPQQQEEEPKKKAAKKPREKKKKRDKGKGKAQDHLEHVMKRFQEESGDEEPIKMRSKSGRKTRKKGSNEETVDENGERLIRTTMLLDDSSSSSDEDRPLTKKQEEAMYRENERIKRNKKIGLKPVYNVKSFDDLAKRREEREEDHKKQLGLEKQLKTNIQKPVESDDSDLEIIGDPKKIAAALASPERTRYPNLMPSPVRHTTSAFRDHNRRMLTRITNEGYHYRIKMESDAKARGQYASATERAKRLLERERDALMINEQINQHFERNRLNQEEEDDDEEDEDYEVDEIQNEYSGSEDEFVVEEADESIDSTNKRKLAVNQQDEEDEDDMAVGAFKRWKNKKLKKSIFDEEDEDEKETVKKQAPKKPEPAHSIANFFRTKENKNETADVKADAKPLSRLVQKEQEVDKTSDTDLDAMDIEEPVISTPIKQKPTPRNPKEKSEYFEEEAEEEEDEFFGAGGSDGDGDENLDEFEKDDLLVEDNNEHVDEGALREAFNKQAEESDKNLIQRLITDITSGGLRKQKAAAEAGLMLEDIDLYEEEDNDLIAIRKAQAARRRKLLKSRGGDALDNLMKDPRTAAFAKAAQAIPDEAPIVFLSDNEGENDDGAESSEEEESSTAHVIKRNVIFEDEDEEDEELDININDPIDGFSEDEIMIEEHQVES